MTTMTADQIAARARILMDQHGLAKLPLRMGTAKRQAGSVSFRRGLFSGDPHVADRLTLSIPILTLWPEVDVVDTILHEIAHALVGHEAGHGPAWKRQASAIGAKPVRCYSSEDLPTPELAWVGVCPENPAHTSQRTRRPKVGRSTSCGQCVPRRYSEAHKHEWMTRAAYVARTAAAQPIVAPPAPVVTPTPARPLVAAAAPAPTPSGRVTAASQGCLF